MRRFDSFGGTKRICRAAAKRCLGACSTTYGRFDGLTGPSIGDADAVRLPEATAREQFVSRRVARLATVDATGRPHIVVTTFALSGTKIYLVVDEKPKTTRHLKRLRNIRANPAVSLLADHYEDDWTKLWWVRVDGHGVIVENPEVAVVAIDLLAERYPQYRTSRPLGPVVVITVHTWTGWTPDQ